MKWEYKSIMININNDVNYLINREGAEGWELAAVTTPSSNNLSLKNWQCFYFKRPVPVFPQMEHQS